MNENKAMRSPDDFWRILEVRQQRVDAMSKLTNESARQSAIEALAQAACDRRWREDPLNLMPYLRFEGLRYMVADRLRAIADLIEC